MWWKGILLSSTNETERVLLHYIFSMYSASRAWLMHIHTLSSRFELSKKYLYSDYYLEVCNFCERHAGHLKGLTTSSFWMGYNEYPKKIPSALCPYKKCTKHAQLEIIAVSTCIRTWQYLKIVVKCRAFVYIFILNFLPSRVHEIFLHNFDTNISGFSKNFRPKKYFLNFPIW